MNERLSKLGLWGLILVLNLFIFYLLILPKIQQCALCEPGQEVKFVFSWIRTIIFLILLMFSILIGLKYKSRINPQELELKIKSILNQYKIKKIPFPTADTIRNKLVFEGYYGIQRETVKRTLAKMVKDKKIKNTFALK